MDPNEERLRDEVIYLHSLWHQGPPRPSKPNPIPVSRPSNRFKKLHRQHPLPPPQRVSSPEWPVPSKAAVSLPRWPLAAASGSSPKPDAGSQKQQAKLGPGRMQLEVLATFRKFLGRTGAEEDADDDDDMDEEEDDDVTVEECKEYRFFLEVFTSIVPLREYFGKHHEEGEFWCFACEKNRKFKSCHALLQHAITVSKTVRRRAHGALASVVCRVLGWDLEKLPVIEQKGIPLSQSLLVQSAVGDDNDAESGKSSGKECQVDGRGLFETLLETAVASAIGEAILVAADTENAMTGDSSQNETDGKVAGDVMDMGDDKNDGPMDNCGYSQVTTSNEVDNAIRVETLLDTDVAAANEEVPEGAAYTRNGLLSHNMVKAIDNDGKKDVDGKVVEDTKSDHKNSGPVDETINGDRWVKTNDDVVEKAMNSGNNAKGGSAARSTGDNLTDVEDAGSSPPAVAQHDVDAAVGGLKGGHPHAPEEQKSAE